MIKQYIKSIYLLLFGMFSLIFSVISLADKMPMPKDGSNIVGDIFAVHLEPGQSLKYIAKKNDVTYIDLLKANPNINPKKPKPWSQIVIPKAYVLPNTEHKGIVINIPEMRLYYFSPDGEYVMTFPVGLGSKDWNTQTGKT